MRDVNYFIIIIVISTEDKMQMSSLIVKYKNVEIHI